MAYETKDRRTGRRHIVLRSKKMAPRSKKAVTKLVKGVIKNQAETKIVTFFSGTTAGTVPIQNSTGLYLQAGPVQQNQQVVNNPTDILKVIPDVEPAGLTATQQDNAREGRYITPTSLTLRCRVLLNPIAQQNLGYQQGVAQDVMMVAWLVQSVSLKSYRQLYSVNDFGKFLDTGEGTTIPFGGQFADACLPLTAGYYRLLAKKTKVLRASGQYGTPVPPNFITNNNSHPFEYQWTWNVGKHLPKKLVYPEDNVTVQNGQLEPLNSSIFWCVAYYNLDGTVAGTPVAKIQQQYVSTMKFKDL